MAVATKTFLDQLLGTTTYDFGVTVPTVFMNHFCQLTGIFSGERVAVGTSIMIRDLRVSRNVQYCKYCLYELTNHVVLVPGTVLQRKGRTMFQNFVIWSAFCGHRSFNRPSVSRSSTRDIIMFVFTTCLLDQDKSPTLRAINAQLCSREAVAGPDNDAGRSNLALLSGLTRKNDLLRRFDRLRLVLRGSLDHHVSPSQLLLLKRIFLAPFGLTG